MKRSWLANKLSVFSCEYYTELVSRSLDGPLTIRERAFFKLHHVICMVCRRYNRQLTFINRAAIRLSGDADVNDDISKSEGKLSEEARMRIRERAASAETSSLDNKDKPE